MNKINLLIIILSFLQCCSSSNQKSESVLQKKTKKEMLIGFWIGTFADTFKEEKSIKKTTVVQISLNFKDNNTLIYKSQFSTDIV